MKKILTVLVVAALVASSVFASFSGSATVKAGANFDDGTYGFTNGTNVKFDIELASASGEAIAEGEVYASVKASLYVGLKNGDEDGVNGADPQPSYDSVADTNAYVPVIKAVVDEAKVAGSNWYISILGTASKIDFAKSTIDSWTVENEKDDYGMIKSDYDKFATYAASYEKAPGVEVGFADYVFGLGFKAKAVETPEFDLFNQYFASILAKTPEYDFNGIKVQVGAEYSTSKGYVDEDNESTDFNSFGASAKVGFANDTLSATVASDLGYDIASEKFGADVAANFTYDFLTVDAFYATAAKVDTTTIENLLSAKVVTDLNSFDVPVKLTATGKDLVNKQDLSLKADFSIDKFTLTPSVGYVVEDEKFSTGIEVKYTADKFTVKGATSVALTKFDVDTTILKASASVESSALIPGATVKLAWADAKDLLNKDTTDKNEYGKIEASVKIEF